MRHDATSDGERAGCVVLRRRRADSAACLPGGLAGTALLLAAAAVFALALGVIVRRSAPVITVVVAVTVLPYILGTAGVLPAGPAEWLLRVTPAAGFAIQQSVPFYEQVMNIYTPPNGYYPLMPWAGLAVLAGYALLAIVAAAVLLRRRDA